MFNFVKGKYDEGEKDFLLLVPIDFEEKETLRRTLEQFIDEVLYPEDKVIEFAGQAYISKSGFINFSGGSITVGKISEGMDLLGINELIKKWGVNQYYFQQYNEVIYYIDSFEKGTFNLNDLRNNLKERYL